MAEGIDIGDFRVEPTPFGTPGKVQIRRIAGDYQGEGGDFSADELEKVIRVFYEEWF